MRMNGILRRTLTSACLLALSPGPAGLGAAQSPGAGTAARKAPTRHLFPVPEGYADALDVDSPATEFFEDLKVSWSLREVNTRGLIAVLARMADVEYFYHGGSNPYGSHALPNPLDVRHCYICFLESGDVRRQLSEMKASLQSAPNAGLSDLERTVKKIKANEPKPLGILRELENGFIFGYLVGPSRVNPDKAAKTARLFLTGTVGSAGGGYFINDVSVVKGRPDLEEALARVEAIARQIHPASS